MKEKKSQQCAGFTLLEVMIALVILAIAMTTIIISSSDIASRNIQLEEKSVASWVAANVMAKTRMGLLTPPPGEKSLKGSEEMFNRQWQWTISRFKTPDKNTDKLVVAVTSSGKPMIEMIAYLVVPHETTN